MGLLSKIFRPLAVKAAEGEYRPGPYLLEGGWLPASWGENLNFWQLGRSPVPMDTVSIVEACVSAYAQTIAMCPSGHWKIATSGGHELVKNSALNRVLRKPNAYQSTSDFLLNLVTGLFFNGNAYALAIRNDRSEIVELHLMNSHNSSARIAVTGDVFYDLAGNEVIDRQLGQFGPVPARDVLHVKLRTPRHPLKGETPLFSAALNVSVSNLAVQQAIAFYSNQSRPSGIIQTDLQLSPDQVVALRQRWEEQSQGLNAGKTPILTAGLKWSPMTMKAEDTQLIEIMKMTREDIALAFRIPLQILGIGGTPFASTEALNQAWLGSSLGFVLNHLEEAIGNLFGLDVRDDEYMGFDTKSLLRSNFKERVDGLVSGVKGGIYSTNEARREEGLAAVEYGDDIRVQQQDVPLGFWANPPKPPPAPEPKPEPIKPEPEEIPEDEEDDERGFVDFSRGIEEATRRHAELLH